MPNFARTAALALICGLLGGCLSTDYAYPVSDGGPNPSPAPGYSVQCQSRPTAVYWLLNEYKTACQQTIPPAGGAVLRARG